MLETLRVGDLSWKRGTLPQVITQDIHKVGHHCSLGGQMSGYVSLKSFVYGNRQSALGS